MEVLSLPNAVNFAECITNMDMEDSEEDLACQVLMARIESELRAAKARYANGKNLDEVLLPSGLLESVGSDILAAARDEPCDIRGCVLNINFLDESQGIRQVKRVGRVMCDPYSVTTFELSFTLRPQTSWTIKLPQFLRILASRSTQVISSTYSTTRKQLYCWF